MGGDADRLPQALAHRRQTRLRLAGPQSGSVCRRLFLAWLPLQMPAEYKHRVLAQEDRDEPATRPASIAFPDTRGMEGDKNQGMRCLRPIVRDKDRQSRRIQLLVQDAKRKDLLCASNVALPVNIG